MATFTVSDDALNSDAAKAYFTGTDRRITIGLRIALETLGLPVPDYARRKSPGPTPAKAIKMAFAADHPSDKYSRIENRAAHFLR